MKSSRYAKTLRRVKEERKSFLKEERKRLKEIKDFKVDETVQLQYKDKIIQGTVKRINIKTYTILANDENILIDKESLTGYSKELKADVSGDSRRYMNEHYKIVSSKDNK